MQRDSSGVLTCDADVRFATFGGPGWAPSDALAPVIFGAKQLLHLLSRDLDAGFPHHQTCGKKTAPFDQLEDY